jgi:hypothetical protein
MVRFAISRGDAGLSSTRLNSAPMCRRLTIFFMMLCMCWQALAFAGSAVVLADADELAHAVMHFEGEAHHHDDHASLDEAGIHQDDSPASTQHLMDEACVFAPALIPVVHLPLPALQPDLPVATIATAAPPPFLDGLERPPRLRT